jgi:hypothetical protein|tara:strand:- start:1296 stop:1478 length:183 start_codon:yes stop_codon:yes gene_type:complete
MMAQEKRKDILSILILLFPSILIAATASIENFLLGIMLRVLLIGYQFVIIKNFVDDYYGR